MPPRIAALLALLGAVGATLALRATPDRPDAWVVAPWLVVWGLAVVPAQLARPAAPTLGAAIAVALAVRLPLITTPVTLSDDLWRYLWEGKVLAAGLDPFGTAPAAIHGLDDALRGRVNHPEIPSIYPPVALLWFRALDALGGTATVARLGAVLADLVTVAAIGRRRPAGAWLWALHPLPAIESAHGGHLEALAVALAALAVGAGPGARGAAAAFAGIGAKLFPIVLLGPLLRPLSPARRAAVIAAGAAALVALAAPVWGAGWSLGFAAQNYARHWSFDGLVFPWLTAAIGPAARPVCVAIFVGVVGAAWARGLSPARVWLVAGTAFVALSPTMHPWYALWALAPAAILGEGALALATIANPLAYLVLRTLDPATGRWAEPPWLWAATWLPFLAFAAVGQRLVSQDRAEPSPTAP